jgi:hypothetical protein
LGFFFTYLAEIGDFREGATEPKPGFTDADSRLVISRVQ